MYVIAIWYLFFEWADYGIDSTCRLKVCKNITLGNALWLYQENENSGCRPESHLDDFSAKRTINSGCNTDLTIKCRILSLRFVCFPIHQNWHLIVWSALIPEASSGLLVPQSERLLQTSKFALRQFEVQLV